MKKSKLIISMALAVSLAFGIAGCGDKQTAVDSEKSAVNNEKSAVNAEESTAKPKELKKIKVGYFGNTCEAPLFAAYEKGFFQEEGLDPEMIKGDANTLKDGLATGKIDVTDGLLMQWVKPIEQGLNIKFTAGLHTGCIQVLIPTDSNIKSFKDFKGKTVGVPAIGGGPMILASRLLTKEGLDSKNDVQWKVFPNSELPLALEKGEVDIIALADPFAQINVNEGKAKSIYNSAIDAPFKDEYCCLVVVNGTLIEKDPEMAAAITRAMMKGAKYASENLEEIAKIETDKKYVPGDAETNKKVLEQYNYNPSIDGGEQAVQIGTKEMQTIGIIDKNTDVDALAKNSFIRLKGVN